MPTGSPTTCVILQPSYLPWRGYFHQIREADVFIFYDDVPFDKHGWRNRNRVKTASGTIWLTVPVHSHGAVEEGLEIRQVRIEADHWRKKHWQTIRQAYARAPFLNRYLPVLEPVYARSWEFLADLTIELTCILAAELGLTPRFVRSSETGIGGGRTERLVNLCRWAGAQRYVSGPSAAAYLDPDQFSDAGIALEYMRYDYPPYPQLHGAFDAQVSILDLLFMTGPRAPGYIWQDAAQEVKGV